MRISIGAVRNVVGLLLGFGFGLILTSPTVSALSMVPGLSLLAPSNNSNVSGTITFAAAADSEGLVSLQFKVDGNDYGSLITAGSCRATFDTRSTGDGPHTVQAVGTDEFGNATFTQPSTIFVNNVAPAISGVFVTNITSSSATINWSTAATADGRVDYGVTMSYGGSSYDGNMGTSHAVQLGGLSSGTTYHFAAMSFGQNGILSSSGDFVFTTAGIPTSPTPTPSPSPTPTPTPKPGPSPTPTPVPTPTPTPIYPTPTPTPTPVPGATPGPTPPSIGHRAPSGSEYVGSAIPRTDDPTGSPTGLPIGSAAIRGATTTNSVQNTSAVGRTSGQAVVNANTYGPVTGTGGGQHLTVSMLMPGGFSAISGPTPAPTPTPTPTRQRGAQSSDSKTSDYTPCAGPNPFLNEGGICVNGTWIKPDPQPTDSGKASTTGASTSSGSSTTGTTGTSGDPATSTDPTSTTSSSSDQPASSKTTSPTLKDAAAVSTAVNLAIKGKTVSSCSTPDPFASKGGVGMCVNGEWVLLWKPGKGK